MPLADDISSLRNTINELTNRVIRLENLFQDPGSAAQSLKARDEVLSAIEQIIKGGDPADYSTVPKSILERQYPAVRLARELKEEGRRARFQITREKDALHGQVINLVATGERQEERHRAEVAKLKKQLKELRNKNKQQK